MYEVYRSHLPVDLAMAADAVPFWEGCREQRLRLCRCDDCGRWIHFPRSICPRCWSSSVSRQDVSGRGTLFTYTVERDGQVLAIVELVEQRGLRLPAGIVDCEADRLRVGMDLGLAWADYDGLPVPAFRPSGAG